MKDTLVYIVTHVVEHGGSMVIGVYSKGKDAYARAAQEQANNRARGILFVVESYRVL